jgi:hypothetical protein
MLADQSHISQVCHAELHESTAGLVGMGQRDGFARADVLIGDPELVSLIRAYERSHPTEGHILRWHLDRAQDVFTSIDDEASAETFRAAGPVGAPLPRVDTRFLIQLER